MPSIPLLILLVGWRLYKSVLRPSGKLLIVNCQLSIVNCELLICLNRSVFFKLFYNFASKRLLNS